MSYIQFNKLMDELNDVLRVNEKRAEALSESNIIDGNRKATDAQGDLVPQSKKEEDAVDPENPEPSKTDTADKASKYNLTDDPNVALTSLRTEAEKSAQMGNVLLKEIYNLLGKRAEDTKSEEEKKKEDSSESDTAKDAADMANVDATLSPEDEEVLKALGAKTAEDRAIYILSKQAGFDFSEELKRNNMNNITLEKQAAYGAGAILADMENRGLIVAAPELEKAGAAIGQMVKEYEDLVKLAYEKGIKDTAVEAKKIIKKAQAQSFEAGMKYGIQELHKKAQEKQNIVKEAAALTIDQIMSEFSRRGIAGNPS